MLSLRSASSLLLLTVGLGSTAAAQVTSSWKISDTQGGFGGTLVDRENFGSAVAALGDVDGDSIGDIAVSSPAGTSGSPFPFKGTVWILFLNANGTVKAEQAINEIEGGFGVNVDFVRFGHSLTALDDMDGDGVSELVVGAPNDDEGGGFDRGAVWILFLDTDGTVKSSQKINQVSGLFGGSLSNNDRFGTAVCSPGDLDGDLLPDLVVGAAGGEKLWTLFLRADGQVDSWRGFRRFRSSSASFAKIGDSVAAIGDLDGDGVIDLAAGEPSYRSGTGGLWILFLNANGTVRDDRFLDWLNIVGFGGSEVGASIAPLGDYYGDGTPDILVGAPEDDQEVQGAGALWILSLLGDGSVETIEKISEGRGGFSGPLDRFDRFGASAVCTMDFNGDAVPEVFVGAPGDGDGGFRRGAVWGLDLDCCTAGVTVRNGSGTNGVLYTSTDVPTVGSTWTATVDCTGHAPSTYLLVSSFLLSEYSAPAGLGEILVDIRASTRLWTQVRGHSGGLETYSIAVPNDPGLIGAVAFTQILVQGGASAELTNALDLRVGL